MQMLYALKCVSVISGHFNYIMFMRQRTQNIPTPCTAFVPQPQQHWALEIHHLKSIKSNAPMHKSTSNTRIHKTRLFWCLHIAHGLCAPKSDWKMYSLEIMTPMGQRGQVRCRQAIPMSKSLTTTRVVCTQHRSVYYIHARGVLFVAAGSTRVCLVYLFSSRRYTNLVRTRLRFWIDTRHKKSIPVRWVRCD